jgi:3-phenylpropionate/trans-cinnamate dioxygenase ferredoxin reductase subunit
MADRAFAAFYYQGPRLIAVDAVNRPGEFLGAKMLIQKGKTIQPDVLTDMSRPMKELVAQAS